MKSIKDVKSEINEIESHLRIEMKSMKDSEIKREKKKLEVLRLLVTYLETEPSEDFIKSEIKRLESVISAKARIFDDEKAVYIKRGVSPKEISKLKTKHESLYEIKKMRTHVKNLRTLLK